MLVWVMLSVGAFTILDPGPATPPRADALAAVPMSATLAARTGSDSCRDVLLLGVDGGAEAAKRSRDFGKTLQVFARAYTSAASGGRTVESRRIGPRFPGTGSLLKGRAKSAPPRKAVTKKRLRAWGRAVPDTVGRTLTAVEGAAVACPDQQVVLAGYSQGAMVVHRVLLRLVGTAVLPRVVGAVLIGDGDRTSYSRGQLSGSPAASISGFGLTQALRRARADVPPVASGLEVRTVCTRGDLVCDTGAKIASKAVLIHQGYGKGTARRAVRQAAKGLWSRTRAWPRPVPDEDVVNANVGQQFSRSLAVDVDPAYAEGVRWENAVGLPPGVTLSSTGLLSGVLSTEDVWEVSYTVRNSSPATSSRRGTITVSAVSAVSTADAGGQSSCRVKPSGKAKCWGNNEYGQLGDGTTKDRKRDVRVGVEQDWLSISTSGSTTCGIRAGGTLWCWGMNHRGQLGLGARGPLQSTPRQVGAEGGWAEVSTGWFHTCARKQDGTLWCWGTNERGQLGLGDADPRSTPTRLGSRKDWSGVSVGGRHTCGTRQDGTAWCWGSGEFGQLGEGSTRKRQRPVQIGADQTWVRLDASWAFTCGVTSTGRALCWGLNDEGQLGTGDRISSTLPRVVAGSVTLASLVTANGHACGLDTAGQQWCWGSNRYGQFGEGTNTAQLAPSPVSTDQRWLEITAGWFHTCGSTVDGGFSCWGNNEDGQLNLGNRTDTTAPAGATVQSPRTAVARRAGPGFVLTSFNILGSQHTRPGGASAGYAPGRVRTEWAVNLFDSYGSDIVGFQELQADQFKALMKITAGRFEAYPGTTIGPRGIWTTMIWNTSVWEALEKRTLSIPFLGRERPNPMVRLRHRVTGQEVWVINVHNVAQSGKDRVEERRKATLLEIAKINEFRGTGTPVLFLGDMNEHEVVFCRVTRKTDLRAANGGSTGRPCVPPRPMRVDWIFASPDLAVNSFAMDAGVLRGRVTDHAVLTANLSLP